jgi:hypothetical protein
MANRPEKKIRCGGVEAAIWQNTTQMNGQDRQTYSIQIQRTYKDKDGNWQETNSYHTSDLPKVALIAQKSFEWITLKQDSQQQSTTIPEEKIQ